MIIPDEADKHTASKAVGVEQTPHAYDPPPTYTSVESTFTSQPLPEPSSYTPINVVNYISISREHGHIKEFLTVDPSLYIPESLRNPLRQGESEGSRKNVRLETVHGHVEAEIVLVQNKTTQSLQRATLHMSSTHGGIKLTIPDHLHRPPFQLTAKSTDGNINLTLPRSFTGPITVSYVHGEVKASALGGKFITLGEANGKMKGFIGDLSKYTECDGAGKGWKGDELVLDLKHGSAKLRFDRDRETNSTSRITEGEQDLSQRKSLFAKIFGL